MRKTDALYLRDNSGSPWENIPERIFLRCESKAETGKIFFVKSCKGGAEHRKKMQVLPRIVENFQE